MDYITRKLKVNDWNDVTYVISTKAEADERGLDYKYWKEAKKGDFCISDDGYVSDVIDRKKYNELISWIDSEKLNFPLINLKIFLIFKFLI